MTPSAAQATASTPQHARPAAVVQNAHVTAGGSSWTVELSRSRLSSTIGSHFSFVSKIRNDAGRTRPGTIAYLNIVSMESSVYVDPEDWSSQRTRYLGVVAPGATVSVPWRVQAVNSGRFVVFVVVTSQRGSSEVVTSKGLRVTIASARHLNPRGIVPVAVGVPGAMAVCLFWTRRRERRLR